MTDAIRAGCPHGDTCHYEGVAAFICPAFPDEDDRGNHCHMEGCRWHDDGCGLSKIGIHSLPIPLLVGHPGWLCGATRSAHALMNDLDLEDIAEGKPPCFHGRRPRPKAVRVRSAGVRASPLGVLLVAKGDLIIDWVQEET